MPILHLALLGYTLLITGPRIRHNTELYCPQLCQKWSYISNQQPSRQMRDVRYQSTHLENTCTASPRQKWIPNIHGFPFVSCFARHGVLFYVSTVFVHVEIFGGLRTKLSTFAGGRIVMASETSSWIPAYHCSVSFCDICKCLIFNVIWLIYIFIFW